MEEFYLKIMASLECEIEATSAEEAIEDFENRIFDITDQDPFDLEGNIDISDNEITDMGDGMFLIEKDLVLKAIVEEDSLEDAISSAQEDLEDEMGEMDITIISKEIEETEPFEPFNFNDEDASLDLYEYPEDDFDIPPAEQDEDDSDYDDEDDSDYDDEDYYSDEDDDEDEDY